MQAVQPLPVLVSEGVHTGRVRDIRVEPQVAGDRIRREVLVDHRARLHIGQHPFDRQPVEDTDGGTELIYYPEEEPVVPGSTEDREKNP